MTEKIRIGLVEDQLLFRQGIKAIIESWKEFEVTFESENGYSVVSSLRSSLAVPHVMLVDLSLPPDGNEEFSGLELTQSLQQSFPEIRVIILSAHNDEYFISRLIEKGAHGYLVKDSDPDEVRDAILAVFEHGSYVNEQTLRAIQKRLSGTIKPSKTEEKLSRREEEVLKLVCQQLTTEEIAEKLFISPKTVNGHRNNLLIKTNSRNVTGLVLYAIKHHIVELV